MNQEHNSEKTKEHTYMSENLQKLLFEFVSVQETQADSDSSTRRWNGWIEQFRTQTESLRNLRSRGSDGPDNLDPTEHQPQLNRS